MESAHWFGYTEIRVKPRNQTLMTTKSMCTLQEMLSWLTEPSGCEVLPQFLEAVVVFPMPVSSQVSLVFILWELQHGVVVCWLLALC